MAMSSTASETRGPELLISIWILEAVSLIFLALRIFCKVVRGRGLWWDDHFLTLSWILTAVTACFNTAAVNLGYGHHSVDIDPNNLTPLSLYVMVGGTPNMVAVATSKIAFALTLTRLTEGKTRAFLWFIIISVAIFMSLANIFLYIKCSPVTKNWDMSVPGECWDFRKVVYFNTFAGAWSAAADFALAFIGAHTVWKLQMRTREKLGVAIAMSVGVFAGIMSVMKTVVLPQMMVSDFSWDAHDLLVWGQAETTVTIIAASIPVLRALFKEVRVSKRSKPTQTYRSADAPSFRYKTALPQSMKRYPTHVSQMTRATDECESDRSTTGVTLVSLHETKLSTESDDRKVADEEHCYEQRLP